MKGENKIFMLTLLIMIFSMSAVNAQDEGFIYGKITTIDGDSYTGALRWGKEEAYWTDMFNASKEENDNLRFLSREERDYLDDQRKNRNNWDSWINVSWNEWDDYEYVHQFATQFGHIKSIEIRSRDIVRLTMKNGEEFEVDGDGYNDIGGRVKVKDSELGAIDIDWDRIEMIEFFSTPSRLNEKFGEPLYGKVETDIGTFTGFVQWDHDERVSTDKLDGDTYDGDLSIPFGNIESIERYGGSRSMVVLKSGRELELRGSNDVNDGNRGIIITVEGLGRVDIEWDEFEKVTFEKAPGSGPAYDDFYSIKKLRGIVMTTEDTQHKGEIIFDLDESYNFEMLNGEDDDNEFVIPFEYISTIKPRNYEYSTIKLTNGDELTLGEAQDVSDRNQGVIVKGKNSPIYIPWEKVEMIKFDR